MDTVKIFNDLLNKLEEEMNEAKANFDEVGGDYQRGLWVGATLAYAEAVQTFKKALGQLK